MTKQVRFLVERDTTYWAWWSSTLHGKGEISCFVLVYLAWNPAMSICWWNITYPTMEVINMAFLVMFSPKLHLAVLTLIDRGLNLFDASGRSLCPHRWWRRRSISPVDIGPGHVDWTSWWSISRISGRVRLRLTLPLSFGNSRGGTGPPLSSRWFVRAWRLWHWCRRGSSTCVLWFEKWETNLSTVSIGGTIVTTRKEPLKSWCMQFLIHDDSRKRYSEMVLIGRWSFLSSGSFESPDK